ncbi:unnamed protein product [Moneuplotes crassus]|uniref:Protein kinase domain-containing protein n=1 Tax=Euplotes crassus TaxID=5936 RepID=A0AAD1UJX6_EUPCR|nr:unnamed protein product [Moneuplotes crassus]
MGNCLTSKAKQPACVSPKGRSIGSRSNKEKRMSSLMLDLTPLNSETIYDKNEKILNETFKDNGQTDFLDIIGRKKKTKDKLSSFEILKKLGKGSLGQVILVRYKEDGQKYAMKSIHKPITIDDEMRDQIIEKRHLLLSLNHPFIASLKFSFQSKCNLFFVYEYLEGGTLKSMIKREGKLHENAAKAILAEIILALEYLHQIEVVCGDLTSQNILFDSNNNIKLTDFSSTRLVFKQDESNYIMDSIKYMAPESIKDDQTTYLSDWWTLGIILYEMLLGKLPFEESGLSQVLKSVTEEDIKIPEDSCTVEAKDLIQSLLKRDPHERLGQDDSGDIMTHPFFGKTNWSNVIKRKTKVEELEILDEQSELYKSTGVSKPESTLLAENHKFDELSRCENLMLTVDGFSYNGGSALALSSDRNSPKKSSRTSRQKYN